MEIENVSADDMSNNGMVKRIKRKKQEEEDNNDNYIYSGGELTEQEKGMAIHVTVADDVTAICSYAFFECSAFFHCETVVTDTSTTSLNRRIWR